jgi:hypothetical protein
MARIDKILERNEKKLVITQFISEECKEYDEEGNVKEDYITIKKIPYDIKTKIKYLSMKSFGGSTSKELLKKYKASGHKISDLENLNTEDSNEIMDFMLDIDFKNIETEDMAKSTLLIEQYIIEYGIDSKKHSFKDTKDNPIELNYETINYLGSEGLIKYILDNIKSFSKGFMLGE